MYRIAFSKCLGQEIEHEIDPYNCCLGDTRGDLLEKAKRSHAVKKDDVLSEDLMKLIVEPQEEN